MNDGRLRLPSEKKNRKALALMSRAIVFILKCARPTRATCAFNSRILMCERMSLFNELIVINGISVFLRIHQVKVMLRISDAAPSDTTKTHYLCIDKKKRQITLTDPATMAPNTTATTVAATTDRGPMVSAPKIFAFDNLFTHDDPQLDVSSSALSEVIPAVLEGTDGCLLTLGYPNAGLCRCTFSSSVAVSTDEQFIFSIFSFSHLGQSRTMFGSVTPSNELGAIPCAIAWLYKGINERRQKSGTRFSVRVSALGVSATKPSTTARDLLAAHATGK